MNQLIELQPAEGATHSKKRRGRGNASGLGRQAGRGHKGWHSRSGSKRVSWYEGGQMPLIRRLPKRGFSNYGFRKEVQIVNIESIARLNVAKVDIHLLVDKGVVKSTLIPIKVLGNGELEIAVEVIAGAFSQSAIDKIEKAGGKAIVQ